MAKQSDAVQRSRIFIYGQIGEQLKKEDEQRVLACLEANPNRHLFQITNDRLRPLIERLKAKGKDTKGDRLKALREALVEVSKGEKFREIAKWMHTQMDDLSMGSTILGEVRPPEADMEDFTEPEDADDYDDYEEIEQEE